MQQQGSRLGKRWLFDALPDTSRDGERTGRSARFALQVGTPMRLDSRDMPVRRDSPADMMAPPEPHLLEPLEGTPTRLGSRWDRPVRRDSPADTIAPPEPHPLEPLEGTPMRLDSRWDRPVRRDSPGDMLAPLEPG